MAHTFKSSGETQASLRAALGRLDHLVDWERRDRASGAERLMRVSLDPAVDLMERVGHPERAWKSIHVAGTKGKGSVAALIAAGLRRAGLRVGVYASPHVERINERVVIDGHPIADDVLACALERGLAARDEALAAGTAGADATWFDVLTTAGFLALADACVDVAVIECGLGGRLDSTNVLGPGPCVITGIELEHTAILGSTRAEIAGEKAGILKPGGWCVSGIADPADAAAAVLARIAHERKVPLTRVTAPRSSSLEERNVALAGAVLDRLVRDGLFEGTGRRLLDSGTVAAARLPGRMERRLAGSIPVLLDGGHVPGSVAAVLREAEDDSGFDGLPVVLLGLGRDKDAMGILKMLVGRVDRVLCTSVGAGPYRDPEDLLVEALEIGLVAEKVTSPRAGLTRAIESVPSPGWILVIGSLHLVGAVRPEIRCLEGTAC